MLRIVNTITDEKPIIKATTPNSKKYDTKIDIYTDDPREKHESIHIAVQCQVVLVKPKTSDNWTSNRGSVTTFFYCALIGLSKPFISKTLAFKCLNFL